MLYSSDRHDPKLLREHLGHLGLRRRDLKDVPTISSVQCEDV